MMDPPFHMLTAAWLAPMNRPPIRDGGVVHSEGTITAVGNAHDLRRGYPGAVITDLGDSLLLPGLVNAHVHLELSALTPGDRPVRFVDWLKRLAPRSPPPPDPVREFAERGID